MATIEGLTDKIVGALDVPEGRRWAIAWDEQLPGFGARRTANGITSFIIQYRDADGATRGYTVGRFGSKAGQFTVEQARTKAESLFRQIASGDNPAKERKAKHVERKVRREEKTFGDLTAAYFKSEDYAKRRPSTQREYIRYARKYLPERWNKKRLHDFTTKDIEDLHGKMRSTPYQGNRVLEFVSKMFNYAIKNKFTKENPARGIEANPEDQREYFIGQDDPAEMSRFVAALDAYRDQNAADALRLLLLTGSRKNEVLKATWDQFNVRKGVWTKPRTHTKQKKTEHVPLSDDALALVRRMRPEGFAVGPLFPGKADKEGKRKARVDLKRPWLQACTAAGFVEEYEVPGKRIDPKTRKPKLLKRYRPTVRIHDLRHSFASHLATNDVSLQKIGKLLGQTRFETTMRYAKLQDGALREATNTFGKVYNAASGQHAASGK